MAGVYRGDQPLDDLAPQGLDDWAAEGRALAGVSDEDLEQAAWRVRNEERHPTYARREDGEVVELTAPEPAQVVPLAVRGGAADIGGRYDAQTRREIEIAVAEADGDRGERVLRTGG